MKDDGEDMSARVAADGVRALIEGRLTGAPLPGTLAGRVLELILARSPLPIVGDVDGWRG